MRALLHGRLKMANSLQFTDYHIDVEYSGLNHNFGFLSLMTLRYRERDSAFLKDSAKKIELSRKIPRFSSKMTNKINNIINFR